MTNASETPWQRVCRRFDMHPAELARAIGRHRSKLSRALADPDGLISGKDQKLLMKAAADRGVRLVPADLTPGGGS